MTNAKLSTILLEVVYLTISISSHDIFNKNSSNQYEELQYDQISSPQNFGTTDNTNNLLLCSSNGLYDSINSSCKCFQCHTGQHVSLYC